MTVTKEEFVAYEQVRSSGVTNMFNVAVVSSLSGLSKEKIIEIIQQYKDLMKKYPDVRE